MANCVDIDQTAVCSGSKLFASILNLSVMLDSYLQQTISADGIFRCIFYWRFKGKRICDKYHNLTCGHTCCRYSLDASHRLTETLQISTTVYDLYRNGSKGFNHKTHVHVA